MKAIAEKNNKSHPSNKPFLSGIKNGGLFGVQRKLTVGESGDRYEREADFLADKAVQRLSSDTSFFLPPDRPEREKLNTTPYASPPSIQQQADAENAVEEIPPDFETNLT